ncbi:hypothetical protein GO003_025210 [Methylicorpusculum oleiharenae]|uniref:hypothetical protein n=1 Tax=Methylicorpusculum oleiharenae TaxID=1338687 RepID=UPI0013596EAC|nr:hypothetical protein [Methylicorpusculum oleiharenae]MCD2453682.1 hypothetical protein [Methylicorpusculum oleiharenae]
MQGAPVLLVIGIHREELAFGRAVAKGLDPQQIQVLTVPEGLSGRRPLPDQSFNYQTLHRALYQQLLPYVLGHHSVLLDLHSGCDTAGPSADLICAGAGWRDALEQEIDRRPDFHKQDVRIVPLGIESEFPHAHTVIPKKIWHNPRFTYLGLEVYLPETVDGQNAGRDLAKSLVMLVAELATRPLADST